MKRRSFLLGAGMLAIYRPDFGAGTPAAAASDSVVVGWKLDEISSLDPAEAFERASTEICRNIYNTLLVYDTTDSSVFRGHAAQGWTSDPDGRRCTIQLRARMTFHS